MNIVSLVPLSPPALAAIADVAPSTTVTQAVGWFDGELRDMWGDYVADGYLPRNSAGQGTRDERDALLANADIVLCGFPPPKDLVSRAPRLRWVHQTPAGASNLAESDLWGSDVVVTTSRGLGNTLPIAEYVVASFLHFARGLHHAGPDQARGQFQRFAYKPVSLAGKTVCIIGAGGIGSEVGRLCAGLGMTVVGTRRSADATSSEDFSLVTGPDRLHELLAESRFVAVCCHWTPETEGLIDAEALAAMPEDAVLVNVARGEVIDEPALVEALDRLRGVALDVYIGEFDRPPPAALWDHPKVLITPHVSGGTEVRSSRPIELFVENLAALRRGEQLSNTIDWDRGY